MSQEASTASLAKDSVAGGRGRPTSMSVFLLFISTRTKASLRELIEPSRLSLTTSERVTMTIPIKLRHMCVLENFEIQTSHVLTFN